MAMISLDESVIAENLWPTETAYMDYGAENLDQSVLIRPIPAHYRFLKAVLTPPDPQMPCLVSGILALKSRGKVSI